MTLTVTGSLTTIPVDSAAFLFSPGNWKGDTGRGGSVYRSSWRIGSWFKFVWTASPSNPSAAIVFNNNAACAAAISYFVNGVLTDNVTVAGTTSISVGNIVAGATNTLWVFVRNSTLTGRWNDGINAVQVTGMQIDSASSAGTAPAARPWVMIVGDSIPEGYIANAGSNDFLSSYAFQMLMAYDVLGYDTCINVCSGLGWTIAGDNSADVPAYYYTSGGRYNDALSSWNKIDQGVSMLDSAGQISSYGATGTTPAEIVTVLAGNDATHTASLTDLGNSIQQGLAALRTAAPSAAIQFDVPHGMYSATYYSQTYVTTIKAAVAAYQIANPSDTKTTLADFGAVVSAVLETNSAYINSDGYHPLVAGHAYLAPMTMAKAFTALIGSSGGGSSYAGGFHP